MPLGTGLSGAQLWSLAKEATPLPGPSALPPAQAPDSALALRVVPTRQGGCYYPLGTWRKPCPGCRQPSRVCAHLEAVMAELLPEDGWQRGHRVGFAVTQAGPCKAPGSHGVSKQRRRIMKATRSSRRTPVLLSPPESWHTFPCPGLLLGVSWIPTSLRIPVH